MPVEVSLLEPDLFPEWRKVTRRGFGDIPTDEHIARRRRLVELDRCFAAMDAGRVVGTGSSHTFRMTVPGGATVATAGIASIATAATHRRRGIMTSMVTALIRQARERGESVAALMPSESSIYGRYGFGPGTFAHEIFINTREAEMRPEPARAQGANYVDRENARRIMPAIWQAATPQRPGWLDRSEAWWNYLHFDDALAGPRGPFFLVNHDQGGPDGYAIYETSSSGSHGANAVRVRELVATTDAGRRALWRTILGIDLAVSVEGVSAPPDDPIFWMLSNPRMLNRKTVDGMWLRLLDVPSALSARSYAVDGRVVLKINDSFDPESSGTFELDARRGHAECTRTDSAPEVELGPAELGAAYLGGAPLRVIASAGRVVEHRHGAVALFDRMFTSPASPWCPHEF